MNWEKLYGSLITEEAYERARRNGTEEKYQRVLAKTIFKKSETNLVLMIWANDGKAFKATKFNFDWDREVVQPLEGTYCFNGQLAQIPPGIEYGFDSVVIKLKDDSEPSPFEDDKGLLDYSKLKFIPGAHPKPASVEELEEAFLLSTKSLMVGNGGK